MIKEEEKMREKRIVNELIIFSGDSRAEIAEVVSIMSCLVCVGLGKIFASSLSVSIVVGTSQSFKVGFFVNNGFGAFARDTPENRAKIHSVGSICGINIGINVCFTAAGVAIGIEAVGVETVIDVCESGTDKGVVSRRTSSKPCRRRRANRGSLLKTVHPRSRVLKCFWDSLVDSGDFSWITIGEFVGGGCELHFPLGEFWAMGNRPRDCGALLNQNNIMKLKTSL